MTRVLRPHLGDTVLELGAGIGNISGRLMGRRLQYVAAEKDPLYLHALNNRFLRTPNVSVLRLDPERPEDFQNAGGPFDTVLCVNVLEYADDPGQLIASAAGVLRPGGSLVLLVPQGPALFGSLDQALGHRRRFSKSELGPSLAKHGFRVKRMYQLNKIGTPGWWLYGKVLRRKHINKLMLKIFDKTVWIWRRIDRLLPWRGLSLIAVASKE
jgi:SAM-dependent methyltransferase